MREYLITDQASQFKAVKDLMTLDLTKQWFVTIKGHVKKRSLNQNALFHKWLDIIADETGHTPEETKDIIKDMFQPLKTITIGRVTRMVRKPTSENDVAEQSKLMDRIMAFAATDLGITLPSPMERT